MEVESHEHGHEPAAGVHVLWRWPSSASCCFSMARAPTWARRSAAVHRAACSAHGSANFLSRTTAIWRRCSSCDPRPHLHRATTGCATSTAAASSKPCGVGAGGARARSGAVSRCRRDASRRAARRPARRARDGGSAGVADRRRRARRLPRRERARSRRSRSSRRLEFEVARRATPHASLSCKDADVVKLVDTLS